MAITATFYNVSDDPRVLNKSLNSGIEIPNIRPTSNCDILSPIFELDYNSNLTTCNYLVVGAPFNRAYFIKDIAIDIGKKISISCAVDVLETYKANIKEINANILRQENLMKEMLPDPNFVYINQNDVISKIITFDGDFSTLYDSNANIHCITVGVNGSPNSHAADVDGFTLLTEQPADWSVRYIFYWVNRGTASEPQMVSIGELVSSSVLPQNVSYADVVAAYGGVYWKNQV